MASKIIKKINIDFSDIKQAGESRRFAVSGDNGAVFSLELSNKDGYYYNFQTSTFQTTKTRLTNEVISDGSYTGNIKFPTAITTDTVNGAVTSGIRVVMDTAVASTMKVGDRVTGNALLDAGNVTVAALDPDDDNTSEFSLSEAIAIADGVTLSFAGANQYDFYLFAESIYDTKHAAFNEVRFADGTFDANSSSGSNANVVQKVIYQTLDVDITINGFSGGGDITGYFNAAPNAVSQTITTSRGKNVAAIPFSITVTVDAGALTIDRQPTDGDIMAFVERTIGAAPVNIPGEDIYPSISDTDTTNATMSSTTLVTMSTNVADKMAVGDKVTGTGISSSDTVTVINITDGTAKQFRASQAVSISSGVTLSFSNRRNYRWLIDNIDNLEEGMQVLEGAFFSEATTIKEYLTQTTVLEGEIDEYKIDNVRVPGLDTLSVKPVITRDTTTKVATTVQSANITFSSQALLSMAGQTLKTFGYGLSEIKRLNGYDIEVSDLKAVLNTVTTTTTSAVSTTSMPVTSKVGIVAPTTQTVNGAITESKFVILDSVTGLGIGQSLYTVSAGTLTGTPKIVTIDETNKKITLSTVQTFADGITLTFPNSIISGIGISNTAVNPYVASIGSSGSLILTTSVAQTLEDEQTFTFSGAGDIVTITGNIKINDVGNEAVTLRFDIDKFLTKHTNV